MTPLDGVLPRRVRRWSVASAGLGALVWIGLALSGVPGAIDTWLSLAVLVHVPLAVALVATRDRHGRYPLPLRVAVVLQFPAGLAAVAGSLRAPGPLATVLVAGWIPVTGLLAISGLWRLLPRGPVPVEELLVDAGLVYLPVGGVALALHALGVRAGFRPVIVHLTAIHYHYAGFLLPVVAGLTGRTLSGARERAVYRPAAVVVVLGMVLVAVGITASPLVEVLAALAFAAAVVALAAVTLWTALRPAGPVEGLPARALLSVAAASIVATMGYAAAYAYGAYAPVETVTIAGMVATHGRINALGFALAGLVAWHLSRPDPRPETVPPGIPFSPLRARWRVGADYPERAGIVADDREAEEGGSGSDEGGPETPSGGSGTTAVGAGKPSEGASSTPDRPGERSGLVDDLVIYAREGFDLGDLHPDVRSLYEETAGWDMRYRIRWPPPFRTGARLALALTARLEQLNLPGPDDPGPHGMDGRIVELADDADPRANARAWVRTDPHSGESAFVAAYATHSHAGETYMNIGLPLPGSNLTAVLYPEILDTGEGRAPGDGPANDGAPETGDPAPGDVPESGEGSPGGAGLHLTTRRTDGPRGDEGLYLAVGPTAVRLPLDESFRVRSADAPGAPDSPEGVEGDPELVARHGMWVLGRKFLEIEYAASRSDDSRGGRDRLRGHEREEGT